MFEFIYVSLPVVDLVVHEAIYQVSIVESLWTDRDIYLVPVRCTYTSYTIRIFTANSRHTWESTVTYPFRCPFPYSNRIFYATLGLTTPENSSFVRMILNLTKTSLGFDKWLNIMFIRTYFEEIVIWSGRENFVRQNLKMSTNRKKLINLESYNS